MWIQLIEKKSEIFFQLKRFKLLVEKHVERSIKKLRPYGGGEYTFNEFVQFCEKEGIDDEIITPYTPEHNVIGQRKNKSIMNMEISMLQGRLVPNNFLGIRNLNYCAYHQNMSNKEVDN